MARNRLNSGYLGVDQRHDKSGVISHKKLWAENLSNSFLHESRGSFNKNTVAGLGVWLNERSVSNKLNDGDNLYNPVNLVDPTQEVEWVTDGGQPFGEGDTLTVKKEGGKSALSINNKNLKAYMGRFKYPFPANGNKHTVFLVMKRGEMYGGRASVCVNSRLAFWGTNQFGTIQEGAGWDLDLLTLPFDPEADYHIYTFRRRGEGRTHHSDYSDFWVDGDSNITRNAGSTRPNRYPESLSEFAFGGGSGSGYLGYSPNVCIKEVLAYKRDLTLEEIQTIHSYLSKKHNITLNG